MKKRTKILSIIIGVSITLLLLVGSFYFFIYKSRFAPDSGTQSNHDNQTNEQVLEESIKPIEFVNNGPAPELAKLTNWMNTEKPLSINQLRGKVILVNFWTYSCNDCTTQIPNIQKWYNSYHEQGLEIIGVHTPRYLFEKVSGNFTNAVNSMGITYPVAQDNDFKTWTAFHTQFWPTTFLIDQNGNIVYTQLGNDKTAKTEKAIRTLLGLEGEYTIPPTTLSENPKQTADIFTGSAKIGKAFGGSEKLSTTEQIFTFPKKLPDNKFALEGSWYQTQEHIILTKDFGRILLNFSAKQINMIASSPEPTTIKIYIDDKLIKGITIKDLTNYQLFDSIGFAKHTMRIEIPNAPIQIQSFNFQ